MKKNQGIIATLILVVLVLVALWVKKYKDKSSTLNEEAKNFKVEDTTSITKIILSDKRGNVVTLEKIKNTWKVNNKYIARNDAIQTLLYTIKMVEVKYPVPKSMRAGVLRTMAGFATKVQIYSENTLIKQYYVGHNTQDYEGTYMLLTNIDEDKNYDEPFICHIPGFTGFLTVRYFTNEQDWRSRLVINVTPPELNYVEYQNFEKPDSSFKIDIVNTNNMIVYDGKNRPIKSDMLKVKQYLAYLQNLNANTILTHTSKKLVDSIAHIRPFAVLNLSYKNPQQIKSYSFYYKPSTPDINSKYGKDYVYDPDHLFVRYPSIETNETETALIQYYVFGKIFQNYSYFLK
ncbi:MAG: DUF4340 domain-containing protein [Bacteroidia bacterium]|nr:DUF4340 domain-containing protein [Bacteroidia bacterium]